jgi:hypothetical protein
MKANSMSKKPLVLPTPLSMTTSPFKYIKPNP